MPEPALIEINWIAGLTIHGTLGARYRIENAPSLQVGIWTTVTNVTLSDGSFTFADWYSTNSSRRFYRVLGD